MSDVNSTKTAPKYVAVSVIRVKLSLSIILNPLPVGSGIVPAAPDVNISKAYSPFLFDTVHAVLAATVASKLIDVKDIDDDKQLLISAIFSPPQFVTLTATALFANCAANVSVTVVAVVAIDSKLIPSST